MGGVSGGGEEVGVLVVEDDTPTRELVTAALAHEGYRVLSAPAGSRRASPETWQRARLGVLPEPRKTGSPTNPSLPTEPTSTDGPPSTDTSRAATPVRRKYTYAMGSPASYSDCPRSR